MSGEAISRFACERTGNHAWQIVEHRHVVGDGLIIVAVCLQCEHWKEVRADPLPEDSAA